MKRQLFALLIASVVALAAVPSVTAQSPTEIMTDEHIQRIKANCTSATQILQRIHVNDAPQRVDRGQVYDLISSKLMARLNSRLALNKLDGSSLVSITSKYDESLTAFRASYITYDDQVTEALKIDCHKQPVAFYDAVAKARELRVEVNTHAVALVRYVQDYGKAFDTFKTQYATVPQEQSE